MPSWVFPCFHPLPPATDAGASKVSSSSVAAWMNRCKSVGRLEGVCGVRDRSGSAVDVAMVGSRMMWSGVSSSSCQRDVDVTARRFAR